MEEARRGEQVGRGRGTRETGQNAEIGMYPAGYSTMERIDSLFNYVFREVTSTATSTFQPEPFLLRPSTTQPSRYPPTPEPAARRSFPSRAVYSYESFSAPLWNLDSARAPCRASSALFIFRDLSHTAAGIQILELRGRRPRFFHEFPALDVCAFGVTKEFEKIGKVIFSRGSIVIFI